MIKLKTLTVSIIAVAFFIGGPSLANGPVFVRDFIAENGLDVGKFGYTLQDFQTVPNDPFTIPKIMTLLDDPFLIPEFTNAGGEYYLEHQGVIGDMLRKCARDSGSYLWRGQAPVAEDEGKSPFTLFPAHHRDDKWRAVLDDLLEQVPEEKQLHWIRLFAACTLFVDARDEALRNIPREKWEFIRANAVDFLLGDDFIPEIYDACEDYDFDSLYRGALILADAFDALRQTQDINELRSALKPGRYPTPIGYIYVGDRNDGEISAASCSDTFMVIELGGDDTYNGFCWNSSIDEPLKIVWDLVGNDMHDSRAEGESGQAAGVLGMALFVDENGDDEYYSETFAQGSGAFGVGILLDVTGDDIYYGNEVVQGAGVFGVGILCDLEGDDEYSCLYAGQGFAYVRAGGLLLDGQGDDIYIARDDEVINPAAQTKEHNVSMAQGAGYGRRADFSDGHFMSGGIAFLVDGAGDDHYSTGVFGQAVGYWFGGGFLYDAGGRDEYYGIWYSQGASAHFAPAGFIDVSGDDVYSTLISQCLGNGRDLSNAVFMDLDGDDSYKIPDRSAGCGNINGFGLFVDLRGNDTYEILSGKSTGRGDLAEVKGYLIREKMDSTGVFIDAGGVDEYIMNDDFPFVAADDSSWGIAVKPGEMSLGIDGEFDLYLWLEG